MDLARANEELIAANELLRLENEQRLQAEAALSERLRFERLLSDLSARFVNVSTERLDGEIVRALKMILEFFQVDRCGLVRTLPGKTLFQITHAAYSEHVPPVPVGTELPVSMYPWAYEKLIQKREVVAYSSLDDLPAEANVDKQTWMEWGIKSNLNIPLLIGEHVDHLISLNSVKRERFWPEEMIPRLQLLGEILVNALERSHRDQRLRESEEGCIRCRLYQDVQEERALMLEEIWASAQNLERHLRSDKFHTVLLVVEMATEPPEIRFEFVAHSAGVEVIEQARTQTG